MMLALMRARLVAALAVAGSYRDRVHAQPPGGPGGDRGAQVPALQGVGAGDVVAFRWFNDAWDQVPVQVDERKALDLGTVYNSTPVGFVTTVYADPGTFTGADPNAGVDTDDELAADGQGRRSRGARRGRPARGDERGRREGQGAAAPSEGSARGGWVYLFERSDGLSPGAGEHYVDYDFRLLSGPYKTTYRVHDGPNPENTTITTPFYVDHFSDRWLKDGLRIKAGGASEVDVLDRAKVLLAPGSCGRSEDTFDNAPDAEGAFIANRVGPVRAIRSYIGANSGLLTQREHVFYDQREDVRTFVRVHSIPGLLDFFDYSPAAAGMRYRSNNAGGGVTIDGNPDSPTAGALTWESVDGAQGGLSIAHSTATDVPSFTSTSYYLDDGTPTQDQCTGDAAAIGSSGPWINHDLPNTDPRSARSTRCA